MDNILDNVVFLVKSIKKRKVESGYTYGEIILSDSLIEKITDLNDNNLIDVSISKTLSRKVCKLKSLGFDFII